MTSGIAHELLQKHQNSAQPSSQTLCAVLRATLEVLQAEGLEATPSALFAAVMSSLERPQGYSTPEVGIQFNLPFMHTKKWAEAFSQGFRLVQRLSRAMVFTGYFAIIWQLGVPNFYALAPFLKTFLQKQRQGWA